VTTSPTAAGIAVNERAFDAWLDRFFPHYYATRPVNATFIGVHDHDHALPDFSPAATARQLLEKVQLRKELAEIPTADLDTARRHDALIADGYLELQIMEDALPQFLAAVRLKPDLEAAQVNLGVVLTRLGRKDEAIAALSAALRLNPSNAQAQHVLELLRKE